MAASPPRRAGRCALALLVSLALHGAVGLALALLPCPGGDAATTGSVGVDACTLEAEEAEGGAAFLVPRPDPAPPAAAALPPVFVAKLTPEPYPVRVPVAPTVPAAVPPEQQGAGERRAPRPTGPGVREQSHEPGAASAGTAAKTARNGTTFFQVETQAETLVYLIDRSSSMGLHGALATARQQLIASLEQLPATARFQVIVYNRTAEPLLAGQPDLMTASPENRQRVALQLSTLTAEGGTDHLPALRRALALHPDVVFFLTDADDLTAEHLRAVTRFNPGRHTVIHAIELNTRNRDRPDMPMHVLARDNRGTYQAVGLP